MREISVNNVTVTESLSNKDLDNPSRLGSFYDHFPLIYFLVNEPVTISLFSRDFDAYLQLINGDTREVITQDDDSGGGVNSRLNFPTEDGINYSGATGNYILISGIPDIDLEIFPLDVVAEKVVNTREQNILGGEWYDYVYIFDNFLDYYQESYQYLQRRNPDLEPPDYYMEYGEKYINRFTNKTRPNLSEDGKQWLDRAKQKLQEAIENKRISDPEGLEQGYASISGQIFHDLNGDGIKSSAETGLPDWTVYLDVNNNRYLDDDEIYVVTDENGNYNFNDLTPDTYTVAQILPEGWQKTDPGITISTTGSTSEIYSPSESETLTTSSTNSKASNLINLDDFRRDPRFTDIDGRGLVSVIIDTGIDLDHPFFGTDANGDGISDRIVYQYDFADNDADASDVNGHGSHVSSILASSNSTYTGVAPSVDIIALKVFKDSGSGNLSDLEESLQWVINNADNYNIASVNLSLSDEQNWNTATSRYGIGDELAALYSMGIIVVAASGNNFQKFGRAQGLAYPAIDPNVLAVGAVWSDSDQIVYFSQRHETETDILAPGIPLTGANARGGTKTLGGTSQATPHIAGIAVLAQQLAMETLGRKLTVSEFSELLTTTGVIISASDKGLDFPRVDMLALAEAILTFNSEATDSATIHTNSTSSHNPLYLHSDSLPSAHTVTLTAGEVVTDLDFGNQQLNQAPVTEINNGLSVDEPATTTDSADAAINDTLLGDVSDDVVEDSFLFGSGSHLNPSALAVDTISGFTNEVLVAGVNNNNIVKNLTNDF
ncbi:MAG: S8 family serine peptidase [Calothrix sp. MO_192.B10]|nr:S8 family serine peptidase [Calothrix sp. MO_192.B10]